MTCAVTETGSAINNETMTGFRICISAEMRLRYFAKKFARLLYVVSDGWKDLGLYANSLAGLETNQGDATISATEWQVRKRSKGRPGCCKYDSNSMSMTPLNVETYPTGSPERSENCKTVWIWCLVVGTQLRLQRLNYIHWSLRNAAPASRVQPLHAWF